MNMTIPYELRNGYADDSTLWARYDVKFPSRDWSFLCDGDRFVVSLGPVVLQGVEWYYGSKKRSMRVKKMLLVDPDDESLGVPAPLPNTYRDGELCCVVTVPGVGADCWSPGLEREAAHAALIAVESSPFNDETSMRRYRVLMPFYRRSKSPTPKQLLRQLQRSSPQAIYRSASKIWKPRPIN